MGKNILIIFLIISIKCACGQDQNVSALWIKATPSVGNQFAKYSSESTSFRLQYRKAVFKDFLAGGGVERTEFRLSTALPHHIKALTLFIQGGYKHKLDPKVDLIGLVYVGYSFLDYSLEQSVTYLRGSKQSAPAAGVSLSMILPLSKHVSFQPEIGYAMILHKLNGFTTTDPMKYPEENSDASFGFWAYRIGLGYNF